VLPSPTSIDFEGFVSTGIVLHQVSTVDFSIDMRLSHEKQQKLSFKEQKACSGVEKFNIRLNTKDFPSQLAEVDCSCICFKIKIQVDVSGGESYATAWVLRNITNINIKI
jgi:hypothetical protein